MFRTAIAAAALAGALVATMTAGGVAAQTAVGPPVLRFLDASNVPRDPSRDALAISHAVTNDASLPRSAAWDTTSADDPENLRIELVEPASSALTVTAALEAVDPQTGAIRARLAGIALTRSAVGVAFRSTFIRLVGDAMDAEAPGVSDRVLRVVLGDQVRVIYAAPGGRTAVATMRVWRGVTGSGRRAIYRGRLRVRVLRRAVGGAPVVGTSEASALAIARTQVAIASEVWGQCGITFGDAATADVALVAPPPPALIAIADVDGLPARGGGAIRLTVAGRAIRPVSTRAHERPIGTAWRVAEAVRALGFVAEVFENPPTELASGRSADIVVRTREGAPVSVDTDGTAPLSSDRQQTVSIGRVDSSDGIQEFENMTAVAGTLEERTLIRLLGDDDPRTVDIFLIDRFTGNTRQGEAFIEGDGGSIANVLLLDRNGVHQEREAWTQAHELGHVLLDQPFHPDNVGPDRPWLLMDADSSLGLVTGPKRLTEQECRRALVESGPGAEPELLSREPDE